jgi:hypothetical protein
LFLGPATPRQRRRPRDRKKMKRVGDFLCSACFAGVCSLSLEPTLMVGNTQHLFFPRLLAIYRRFPVPNVPHAESCRAATLTAYKHSSPWPTTTYYNTSSASQTTHQHRHSARLLTHFIRTLPLARACRAVFLKEVEIFSQTKPSLMLSSCPALSGQNDIRAKRIG